VSLIVERRLAVGLSESEGKRMESGREGGICGEESAGDAISFENSLWYHSESDSSAESTRSRLKFKVSG
jgi:hypothetical protein